MRKAALEILYFLKYILEISYRHEDKITVKYQKEVISTFFTVAPFCCTPLVILDFCFILLTFNTASLVGTHRSRLEVEDFIFHVVAFSRETFQTLTWKSLLCVLQKVLGGYVLFSCSTYFFKN